MSGVTSEGIIAIVVAAGAVAVIIIASIMFWCFCCRRASTGAEAKGAGSKVPLQIVSTPPEGAYSAPLVVELRTVQPNLDILVRIVAVDENGSEVDDDKQQTNVARDNGNGLVAYAGEGHHAAVAGLMLYRDALEFTEPGTYYILAHTLSPDKAVSEVHQFHFVVGGSSPPFPGSAVVQLGMEPPTIEPCRGEVTRGCSVTISHPLHSSEAQRDRIGGHTDAVRALVEQSDVALWYSLDGSFPRTRYFSPFQLSLPSHQTQHRVTIRAISTSLSRGIASDVVEANLTVVTDRYHFFDPSVPAPTLQLNASGSLLYFEDPKPGHLTGDGGASRSNAGSSGLYHPPPPISALDQTRTPASVQRYDLAGGTWRVMYCMEYVDVLRHQSAEQRSARQHHHAAVSVSGHRGGGAAMAGAYWLEYNGPVHVPTDVARIAAFSTCSVCNRTLRSAIVTYDVSLQHGSVAAGLDSISPGLPGGDNFVGHTSGLKKASRSGGGDAKKSKKDKKGKTSKKSGNSVDELPSNSWESKVLHYDALQQQQSATSASASAAAAFPPPPLSSYVEDTSLIPSPVMCVTCRDVEVTFDDPPRGGVILYTMNDTDPVADLDADTPGALEYRPGSAPIKILRGAYEQVALTARIVFPIDVGGGGGTSSSTGRSGGEKSSHQSYRYGHRFSRHFYVQ